MSWYNVKDADAPLIADGWYEATIASANYKLSKEKQIPMYDLGLVVYNGDAETKLRDFLMSGDGTWKVKMFADALGAGDEFTAQTFKPDNYVGKNIRVQIVTKPSRDPQYGPQNSVKKYEPTQMGQRPAPATVARPAAGSVNSGHKPMSDDDIPW